LGATSVDVGRLVVGEALRLAGVGAALGLAGAVATSGLLRGLLFGIRALDPATLAAAVAVLLATVVVACYFPIRRAMRVNPAVLLRAK
jgi:putative ABC transport system permease protein